MDPTLALALRRNTTRRAHLYGAEAVILSKQAATTAPSDSLAQTAADTRRRYFRELEAVDLLGGHPSPFGPLG